MSSCVDTARNLSQISQTDISFSDCTAKYLPLEKVYFHILEKIQEAFLDLRNWDCSFNSDVTSKASTTPRDSIIRRACKRPLSREDSAPLSYHVDLPAKFAKEDTASRDSGTQCGGSGQPLISSDVTADITFSPVKTPDITISPVKPAISSISPMKLPENTMLSPKGIAGVLDSSSYVDQPKNSEKNPPSIDFTLINPFLASAFTNSKKHDNIQFDDLNSLRCALTNALKQSAETNNLTTLSKAFLANQPNSSTTLRAPLFPSELNLSELMSQSNPFKMPHVNTPHVSSPQVNTPQVITSQVYTPQSSPSTSSFPTSHQLIDDAVTTPKTEAVSPASEYKEKLHQCPYCDTKFNQKSNLKTHVFGVHQFKLSTCRTCKIITSKEKLKEHMKTHPNRGFKCHQCDTSFDTHIRLLRHMKIHSSERPYKCSYCPKSFVYKWNLTEHVRIHTGEKPFVCRMCGKGFCQSSTLKRHSLAMHTMDKPYKCSQCKESFVRILLLKKHFVNHHMGPSNTATSPPTSQSIVAAPFTHPMTTAGTPPLHPLAGGLTPHQPSAPSVTTSTPDALSMLHMINSNINNSHL